MASAKFVVGMISAARRPDGHCDCASPNANYKMKCWVCLGLDQNEKVFASDANAKDIVLIDPTTGNHSVVSSGATW
jgi:hypothetical protein